MNGRQKVPVITRYFKPGFCADESLSMKECSERIHNTFGEILAEEASEYASVLLPLGDASAVTFAIACRNMAEDGGVCYSGEGAGAEKKLSRMLLTDIALWLEGDIFLNAAKMSGAHHVEVRTPLSDLRMFRTAAGIPDRYKVCGGSYKVVI